MLNDTSALARRTAVIGGVTTLIIVTVLVAWQVISALMIIYS